MVTVTKIKKNDPFCLGSWEKPGNEGFDYFGCFIGTEKANQVIGRFLGFCGNQSVRGEFIMEKTPGSKGPFPVKGEITVEKQDYSQISETNMDVGINTEPPKRFTETADV
jgi:hypothetical protein